MEYFGVDPSVLHYPLHGRSLLPLLRGEAQSLRESVIFGYFGRSVGYTDGEYTYFRAAASEENRPLYVYAGMPTILRQYLGADGIAKADYKRIEMGIHAVGLNDECGPGRSRRTRATRCVAKVGKISEPTDSDSAYFDWVFILILNKKPPSRELIRNGGAGVRYPIASGWISKNLPFRAVL